MVTTKRTGRTVAETPLPLVKRLLGAADETEVLVGGQALSVWIGRVAQNSVGADIVGAGAAAVAGDWDRFTEVRLT